MRTRHLLQVLALVAASALTSSCNQLVDKALQAAMETVNHDYQDSEKWGKVTTIGLPGLAFHEVELTGAVRMEFTQDSIYSIEIYGNEKAIDAYSIKVDDGELNVTLKEGLDKVNNNTPAITIRIAAPYLSEITGSGASEVIFMNSVKQQEGLEVNIVGVGKFSLGELKTKELDMTVSGAGEVQMDELCCTEDVEFKLSGAANIDGKIECRKLKLKMSGAGSGKLDIYCQQVRVSASGATNVTLTGECHDYEALATGSSSVNHDDLK